MATYHINKDRTIGKKMNHQISYKNCLKALMVIILTTMVFAILFFMQITYWQSRPVDYTKLENALAAEKWTEADQETTEIMIMVSRKIRNPAWFGLKVVSESTMEKFPCENLRTIDQLWVKHSQGRFGFSVQQRIWQESKKNKNYVSFNDYDVFMHKVGWFDIGKSGVPSIMYAKDVPNAHLPSYEWMQKNWDASLPWWFWSGTAIWNRTKSCGLQQPKAGNQTSLLYRFLIFSF